VFPGETLNLHIFEPRYKQLISERMIDKKPFGIPPVFNSQPAELGTLMTITEVVKEYSNGELDIRIKADKVFRILEIVPNIPGKLYTGAIVSYPDNSLVPDNSNIAAQIINEVLRLYKLFNTFEKLPVFNKVPLSYEIGHLVGLSREQEYELLGLFTEVQRMEYIRRHLNNLVPVINELETMKARVQMNGHFRNLSLD
jgi:hypothetical protein